MTRIREVSHFPPEALEFWRQASEGKIIELVFDSRAQANRARARLYALRKAMVDNRHWLAQQAIQVQLRIEPEDALNEHGRSILIATLADQEIVTALTNAGIRGIPDEDTAGASGTSGDEAPDLMRDFEQRRR